MQDEKIYETIQNELNSFFTGYEQAVRQNPDSTISLDAAKKTFITFVKCVEEQIKAPYQFSYYHQAIRSPFDYHKLGLDFVRPLINFSESTLTGEEELFSIVDKLKHKENVILLANHQTEIDPQIISLMLEKKAPKLAEKMIFIAGHRVVQDPLATPLSMGCNLLCIYSKKYVDHPPEKKAEKLTHNRRTLKAMEELLKEGGKCIYVAPSGGRDRQDQQGNIVPSPFDPDSIEMLTLVAKKAETKTHFHPLTLFTYPLLPPPKTIHLELGETRVTEYAPVHLHFGKEIDMEVIVSSVEDKQEKRRIRAKKIWQTVCTTYQHFPNQVNTAQKQNL